MAKKPKTKRVKAARPARASKAAKGVAQSFFAPLALLQSAVRQAELNAQAIEALSQRVLDLASKLSLPPDATKSKLLTEPNNSASNLME